jgi:asparagine N-glycosylation enzyme membrane subunit Stt3
MDQSTLAWLTLITFGFAMGVSAGPMALARIGLGLAMLCGLGVLLANTSGHEHLAYWCVVGMVAVVAAFAVAFVAGLVGAAVRDLFKARRRDSHAPAVRT